MSTDSHSPLPHHSFTKPRPNGLPYHSSTLTPNHRPSRSLHTNNNNNINSTNPSRSLITVLPPASLPSNPPQVRSSTLCSGYGPPSGFSRGILIPLYPTLAAQMAAIAREYGLPSTGGMMVYMIEASPQLGELAKHMVGGPKISEAAWNILWSGIFEEEEAEAFERELLQRDQLYSEPVSRQFDNHQEAGLNEDEQIEEEALNSCSLEDIIGSAIDFPIPPAHHRPSITPDHHHHNHPAQASSISSSDDPKLHHTHTTTTTTTTIDRRIPPRQRTDDRFKLADRLIHHAHSHSSIISNKINPTRFSSSADVISRPTSPTSARPPFRSARRNNSIRPAHHPPPMSDRGSSYSASSLRPRRIGAGMIVGKIEFDIDCSRSSGRWYQQWLNPSKLPRNDYSLSTTPVSADSSRPLLLPNLITQRSQSSTSHTLHIEKESPTSHFNDSLRSTDLNSSQNQTDNSHSFLAFDDPAPLSGSDLSRSQLALDSSTDTPDRSKDYRNSTKLTSEKYPLDSGRIFYSNEPRGEKSSPPGERNETRRVGGRIVSDKHRQAISLIEAQAKHQSMVEQIDAQLSSPIKLEPVPQHHSYGFGNLTSTTTTTTTTLPGLSLEVSNRPDLADSRYKRNEEGSHSSCTSSPDTDPANMTHSSTGSTSSNSSVDVPDNQELLLPGLWASKRSSSMAIEANLKELEQALVSLSPRALRSSPHPLPSPISLASSSPNPLPIATQASNNPLAGSSICSPEFLIHAGPNKNRLNSSLLSSSNSSAPLQSANQEHRGGMSKFFDSLQESYQEIKARSSLLPPQPQHSSSSSSASSTPSGSSALSGSEIPVGNLSGYTREDVRETQAPTSPLPTITSFSPNPTPNPTPHPTPNPTPTTAAAAAATTTTTNRRNNSFKLPPRTTSFFRKNSSSSSVSSTAALAPLSSSISSTSHPHSDGFVSKAAGLVVGKFRTHSAHLNGFASPKRKITLENLPAS